MHWVLWHHCPVHGSHSHILFKCNEWRMNLFAVNLIRWYHSSRRSWTCVKGSVIIYLLYLRPKGKSVNSLIFSFMKKLGIFFYLINKCRGQQACSMKSQMLNEYVWLCVLYPVSVATILLCHWMDKSSHWQYENIPMHFSIGTEM